MIEEIRHWEDFSACQYVEDPAQVIFFEDEEDNRAYPFEAQAKAICAACPVRADCLDAALRDEERWGIRGGMTYMERRKVVRRRKKNADLCDRLFDHMVKGYLEHNGVSLQMYGMQEVLP